MELKLKHYNNKTSKRASFAKHMRKAICRKKKFSRKIFFQGNFFFKKNFFSRKNFFQGKFFFKKNFFFKAKFFQGKIFFQGNFFFKKIFFQGKFFFPREICLVWKKIFFQIFFYWDFFLAIYKGIGLKHAKNAKKVVKIDFRARFRPFFNILNFYLFMKDFDHFWPLFGLSELSLCRIWFKPVKIDFSFKIDPVSPHTPY